LRFDGERCSTRIGDDQPVFSHEKPTLARRRAQRFIVATHLDGQAMGINQA